MVFAFWSTAATGQGSLRGLGIFQVNDPQTITITVDMDVPDLCDAFELLNGPILSTLNGEFSTLTGNDADTGTMEVSLAVDNSAGGRRLGTYSYSGPCKRCPRDNRDRRALTAGFSGALKSAVRRWCKDEGDASPCCESNGKIAGVSYDLSE
jgi:hypothetical protein